MTESEFANYIGFFVSNYAQDMSRSEDLTIEVATLNANESFAKLLPDGFQTTNNYFFSAVDSEAHLIGKLWFSKRANPKAPAIVYA